MFGQYYTISPRHCHKRKNTTDMSSKLSGKLNMICTVVEIATSYFQTGPRPLFASPQVSESLVFYCALNFISEEFPQQQNLLVSVLSSRLHYNVFYLLCCRQKERAIHSFACVYKMSMWNRSNGPGAGASGDGVMHACKSGWGVYSVVPTECSATCYRCNSFISLTNCIRRARCRQLASIKHPIKIFTLIKFTISKLGCFKYILVSTLNF